MEMFSKQFLLSMTDIEKEQLKFIQYKSIYYNQVKKVKSSIRDKSIKE